MRPSPLGLAALLAVLLVAAPDRAQDVRCTAPDADPWVFETKAPDFTIVSLETRAGFPDPEWAREAAAALSGEWGLDIDWTTAERSTEGDLSNEAYWDPETGLNGQVRFSYRDGTLVAVTISRS